MPVCGHTATLIIPAHYVFRIALHCSSLLFNYTESTMRLGALLLTRLAGHTAMLWTSVWQHDALTVR